MSAGPDRSTMRCHVVDHATSPSAYDTQDTHATTFLPLCAYVMYIHTDSQLPRSVCGSAGLCRYLPIGRPMLPPLRPSLWLYLNGYTLAHIHGWMDGRIGRSLAWREAPGRGFVCVCVCMPSVVVCRQGMT